MKTIKLASLAFLLLTGLSFAQPEPVAKDGTSLNLWTQIIGGKSTSDTTKAAAIQVDPTFGAVQVELATTPPVSITSGPQGAPHFASGQVTVSNSAATVVVAATATQRSAVVRNTDASITMYLGGSSVTSATGMPLKAGESISVDTNAAIYCRAASGSPVAAFVQVYD